MFYGFKGLFGLRSEREEVERNRIKLTENKLILDKFYSILLYFPFFPFI